MSTPFSRSLFLKLFVASFGVVLVTLALGTWLAIRAGRDSIEQLVVESQSARARQKLDQVNLYLAHRAEEIAAWAGLSQMDEILIRDRFLAIEHLLLELQRNQAHDYDSLAVLDTSGEVVAASDVGEVGTTVPIEWNSLSPTRNQVRMGPYPDPGSATDHLLLVHPIVSRLSTEAIGWFVARLRWDSIERILATSAPGEPHGPDVFFLLVDSDDRILAGLHGQQGTLPEGLVVEGHLKTTTPRAAESGRVGRYLVTRYGGEGKAENVSRLGVILLRDLREAFAVVRIFIATVAGSAVLALVLAAGASWFGVRWMTRRLGRLVEGTGRLARGELSYRVEEGDQDEIGRLARAFNLMGEELGRARQEIEATLAHWQSLVNNAPDIITTVDRNGTIVFMNRVFPTYDMENVVGSSIFDYVAEPHHDELREGLRQVFETGTSVGMDLEAIGPEGLLVWYSSRLGPVIRAGRPEAVTIVSTDITDRRRLESEILEVLEVERERIGRDLHDGLGQVLTGISLLSKGLQQRLEAINATEAEDAGRIKNLAGEAIQQARVLAKGLFPLSLERNGFGAALTELAAGVEQVFRVSCRVDGNAITGLRDRSVATHLFRIAQEAVSNSLRHGKARNLVLKLSEMGPRLVFSITDDGCGFSPGPTTPEGMGLRTMRYRARLIGATMSVRSNPGRGTVVTCTIRDRRRGEP